MLTPSTAAAAYGAPPREARPSARCRAPSHSRNTRQPRARSWRVTRRSRVWLRAICERVRPKGTRLHSPLRCATGPCLWHDHLRAAALRSPSRTSRSVWAGWRGAGAAVPVPRSEATTRPVGEAKPEQQPSTKTASLLVRRSLGEGGSLGKTKSGLPSTADLRRQPVMPSARKTATSRSSVEALPEPFTVAMSAERWALVGGYGSWFSIERMMRS